MKNKPISILAGLLVMHVLAHIDRNMLLAFAPQITRELQLSNAQYGFLSGAVWVLSFGFMAMLLGSLADRYSRTKVMAFGVFVWSVCTAASGYAHSFEQMVLARFLVATGEAALVPAAVSLLAEIFSAQRRSTAIGVFFIGIPLGIGFSFVIAGTLGNEYGWRSTFMLLGIAGAMAIVPLLLVKDRRVTKQTSEPMSERTTERGVPFGRQLVEIVALLKTNAPLRQTMVGLVLIHFAFAGMSFVQLWLVRERGLDTANIAKQIGLLQIVFGTLGALAGGIASDRLASRFAGGHATVLSLMVLLCSPLIVAYRLAEPQSALFYIGMCASFFLPLACYGPSIALLQALTPVNLRSTITGAAMMLINVFAIAIGNISIGTVSDLLTAQGSSHALTTVLIGGDLMVALSFIFYWRAARSGDERLGMARDRNVVVH